MFRLRISENPSRRLAPCFVPAVKDILKVTAGLALYAIDSLLMERNRNWNYRRVHLAGFAPDESAILKRNLECELCGDLKYNKAPRLGAQTQAGLPRGVLPLTPYESDEKHKNPAHG